jgi:phospholipase/carboxylesterase
VTRREILQLIGGASVARCASTPERPAAGRLSARPHPHAEQGTPGVVPLNLATPRDGLLYVPRAGRLPLILMLHGAGGMALPVIQDYRARADEFGFMLLVPESRGKTWDVVHEGFGPDVKFINNALAWVFNRYDVDQRHLAVAGFSDGASYALSLGITNGDLFSHVMAFSPGFALPASQHGAPRMFISHGNLDAILPIANTKRIVSRLQSAGYDVRFEEFSGPHRTPVDITAKAFAWFTAASSSRSAQARM